MSQTDAGILINSSRWPLVTVTYTTFTNEEHIAHFKKLKEMFFESPDGVFVVLVDLRKAQTLDAAQRRNTVDFWKDVSPLIDGRFLALAYVSDNPIIRGIIQAVSWFQKPPAPMRTLGTMDEADAWLQDILHANRERKNTAT